MATTVSSSSALSIEPELLENLRIFFRDPSLDLLFCQTLPIRNHLRETLYQYFRKLRQDEPELLNLEKRPNVPGTNLSIAHTRTMGVIALSKQLQLLGTDIEEATRSAEKGAARASDPKELKAAPSPLDLWLAKEAAFKAYSPIYKEMIVISQIGVSNWETTKNLTTFTAKAHIFKSEPEASMSIKGIIFDLLAHRIALAAKIS